MKRAHTFKKASAPSFSTLPGLKGYPVAALTKKRASLVTYRHSAGQRFENPLATISNVNFL
jgi:hypothetical protein